MYMIRLCLVVFHARLCLPAGSLFSLTGLHLLSLTLMTVPALTQHQPMTAGKSLTVINTPRR